MVLVRSAMERRLHRVRHRDIEAVRFQPQVPRCGICSGDLPRDAHQGPQRPFQLVRGRHDRMQEQGAPQRLCRRRRDQHGRQRELERLVGPVAPAPSEGRLRNEDLG
eukprot:15029385-Alexandrium_andersonii.AAC.1